MNAFITKLAGLALLLAGLALPAAAAGKLRIVTTYTDLAEFARTIGAEHVEVKSLCTGVEDTHGVPMRPSFLPLLNRADLMIVMGMSNEHSYLPALLDAAKNPRILEGKPGYIDCSRGITPKEMPMTTDRSEGDVHPAGNPHYNLDPVMAKIIVGNIGNALEAAAPEHAADFRRNRDAYLARLDAKIAEWAELAKPLKGMLFVCYHNHWPYFADRYGLVEIGTIELKAGVDPTPRHLDELVQAMKAKRVPVIIREPQFPERLPKQVAAQTGARVAKLAIMVGGDPEAKSYIDMVDYHLRSLIQAANGQKKENRTP
jgi:zinc/manganese transport system substrate-binding protein